MVPEHIVVVGGSLAGLRALETARRAGYAGRLTLIGAETHLPYDRPPLSKEYIDSDQESHITHFTGVEELADGLGVSLMLGQPATSLDLANGIVHVGDCTVPYDAALIATGATARTIPAAAHLDGVVTLRTIDDARIVRSALDQGARVVVVGAGFIGAEVAAAVRKRGRSVTVVEALPIPLIRAVGETAGRWLSALHERNGTELICGVAVESISGDHRVEGVRLANGRHLPADLVVVGIGATPATDWLTGSGLTLDNGIVCDATMHAGGNVWAAGDVARWFSQDFETSLRIEHWTNAAEQGAHAMRNLLDPSNPTPYRHIPYFWSDWYGNRIQLAGRPIGEPTVVTGDPATDVFTALYRDGDRLIGALALNRRSDIMKYRALIARGSTWEDGLKLAQTRNNSLTANSK
ncbi:NAD(P)/FAD-dependent oxidoreductase [Rhodococcus aetherivorans]|uniref:NAD(P)/FAD-dependent oxidoreductase n=1 Tax=Rhodococcus aetherivorans TaxID=191292 RepID=UPI0002D22A86|nr:FAD-dependent oxidoreductase [Rhodococcus aetherivorans]CCW10271.1 Ferredoxin reductase [Rhodococcus aetherivorans]